MAEPLESETSELFKQAFGHHPAGVAVITATDDAGEPAGFTASSLTSVAAEPAIVAFSLKADSGSAGKIAAAPSFLIHMLDAEFIRHDLGGTPLVYHSRSFHALGKHSNVDYAI